MTARDWFGVAICVVIMTYAAIGIVGRIRAFRAGDL